jgi:hypothetical protein
MAGWGRLVGILFALEAVAMVIVLVPHGVIAMMAGQMKERVKLV